MKAVLFDLDGVLLDTETQYTDFWHAVGQQYFPEIPDFATVIKGMTLTQITNHYFTPGDARLPTLHQNLVDFEAAMRYPIIEGVDVLLDTLHRLDIRTAVVTSSNAEKMARVADALPGFLDRFDRVFTAEHAHRSKPAPDCYLNAAAALGFVPADCLVVEDSRNGLLAGRAAGCTVWGVAGTLPLDVLRPLADRAFARLTDLSEAVVEAWS